MLSAKHSAEGVCYTTLYWRRQTALNVVGAGGRLFAQASVIRHLDRLAILNAGRRSSQLRLSRLIWSLDQPVLDAVRIACCFENLFKARLILSGCVVHEIDKQVALSLWRTQRRRPLLVREVRAFEGIPRSRDIDYTFASLRQTTLPWHVLSKPAYVQRIGITPRLRRALMDVVQRRNTLHFLAPGGVVYSDAVFGELRYIRNCYNRLVVRPHARLLEKLGFPSIHRLNELPG